MFSYKYHSIGLLWHDRIFSRTVYFTFQDRIFYYLIVVFSTIFFSENFCERAYWQLKCGLVLDLSWSDRLEMVCCTNYFSHFCVRDPLRLNQWCRKDDPSSTWPTVWIVSGIYLHLTDLWSVMSTRLSSYARVQRTYRQILWRCRFYRFFSDFQFCSDKSKLTEW